MSVRRRVVGVAAAFLLAGAGVAGGAALPAFADEKECPKKDHAKECPKPECPDVDVCDTVGGIGDVLGPVTGPVDCVIGGLPELPLLPDLGGESQTNVQD